MKRLVLGLAVAALTSAAPALAQDEEGTLYSIMEVEVKLGHMMKFREGVMAYKECYADAGGEGEWGAWRGIDGPSGIYHIVSTMDGWGDMDEDDEAGMSCYSVVEAQIAPHMNSQSMMFTRTVPKWSAEESPDDTTVVRITNFHVNDGQAFSAVVGSVTKIMRATKYEHMGSWHNVLGGHPGDPDYMVVSFYKNFAEMDEDRTGPYKISTDHMGEDGADLMWEQFGDSLDKSWVMTLAYDEDLSHSDD